MNDDTHPGAELSAYADGELAPAEHERISAHLDTCAECRELLQDFTGSGALLRSLPVPNAPPYLVESAMRLVEARSRKPSESWLAGFVRGLSNTLSSRFAIPAAAGLAAVGVAVIVSLDIANQPANEPQFSRVAGVESNNSGPPIFPGAGAAPPGSPEPGSSGPGPIAPGSGPPAAVMPGSAPPRGNQTPDDVISQFFAQNRDGPAPGAGASNSAPAVGVAPGSGANPAPREQEYSRAAHAETNNPGSAPLAGSGPTAPPVGIVPGAGPPAAGNPPLNSNIVAQLSVPNPAAAVQQVRSLTILLGGHEIGNPQQPGFGEVRMIVEIPSYQLDRMVGVLNTLGRWQVTQMGSTQQPVIRLAIRVVATP